MNCVKYTHHFTASMLVPGTVLNCRTFLCMPENMCVNKLYHYYILGMQIRCTIRWGLSASVRPVKCIFMQFLYMYRQMAGLIQVCKYQYVYNEDPPDITIHCSILTKAVRMKVPKNSKEGDKKETTLWQIAIYQAQTQQLSLSPVHSS